MGNFYTNITLHGADRTAVLSALKGRNAAVSPTVHGFTVVWDEKSESQDLRILDTLTKHLSSELNCPAWAILNHDDDLLLYKLFARGEELDRYNSFPGYFEGSSSEPEGGDAEVLAKTFSAESAAKSIERILRTRDGYVFAMERHQALIEALGMPSFGLGMGYRYLTKGERPSGLEDPDTITFSE